MKPVIKYQGGKSKELPLIKERLPKRFNRVVEPFCGGAAVSFGLQTPALLSDINPMVINLYKVLQSEDFIDVFNRVNEVKSYSHDALQEAYYAARDVINRPDDFTPLIQAISYIIVRQLCFSGMERYNSDGKFNVPFGHYKRLSCNLSPDHHTFLKKCDVRYASFDDTLADVNDDDFVFIDPPYLERLGYTEGDGGFELHSKLHSILSVMKAPWMIIHSDHEFYREYYKDFNIVDKDFTYAQRFGKDKVKSQAPTIDSFIEENVEKEEKPKVLKDHTGSKVKHLYITNY